MRYFILIIGFLLFGFGTYGQTRFKVVVTETDTSRDIYSFVDENGKTIRTLDTSSYFICLTTDNYGYFAIFRKRGFKGWAAIDADEKVLFNVYNTSFGEPTPDYLVENKIRIVDSSDLIGFANYKGQIIIKPQFEIATSFSSGKAIIGRKCQKIPWDKHAGESDCHHYSIICKEHGYINERGTIVKVGDYTFEEIRKEVDWKAPEEQEN